jgi:hypothetical protein
VHRPDPHRRRLAPDRARGAELAGLGNAGIRYEMALTVTLVPATLLTKGSWLIWTRKNSAHCARVCLNS